MGARIRTVTVLLVLAAFSAAQPPPLPSDLLEGGRSGRRITGNTLIFCLDARDPAHLVDREIAAAMAGALLLEPEFHLIESDLVVEVEAEKLYIELVDNCHVYLGFKLLSGTYANWATLTRDYYRTTYVLAVRNPDWESLDDIPRDSPLGGVPGTPGDIRLLSYLNSLPQGQRWPRHPRGSHEEALEAVIDGSLGGALVWAPALWHLRSIDPRYAELNFFEVEGVSEPIGVGGVMLSGNAFLRQSLDDAIVALSQEGLIESILEEFDFPAQPPDVR